MNHVLKAECLTKIPTLSHGFFGKRFGLCKTTPLKQQEAFIAIGQELDAGDSGINIVKQVHSSLVQVLTRPLRDEKPEADALITVVPGLFIGILTADCVPILLATKKGDMVAAVHAGWRGAFGGVIENTLTMMQSMGATRIEAALGPCIWQDSYEVSEDFYKECTASSFFKPGLRFGHWLFDLPGFVTERLKKAGICSIAASPADTYREKSHFNSFRRSTHDPNDTLMSNVSAIGIHST